MDRKTLAIKAYQTGNPIEARLYAIGHLVRMNTYKNDLDGLRAKGVVELMEMLQRQTQTGKTIIHDPYELETCGNCESEMQICLCCYTMVCLSEPEHDRYCPEACKLCREYPKSASGRLDYCGACYNTRNKTSIDTLYYPVIPLEVDFIIEI